MSNEQNSRTIPIALIFLAIVSGYLYYSQILKGQSQPAPAITIPAQDGLSKFSELKSFNFSIFDDEKFKSLRTLGESPVEPGPTGRNDPFLPF